MLSPAESSTKALRRPPGFRPVDRRNQGTDGCESWRDSHALAVAGSVVAGRARGEQVVVVARQGARDEHLAAADVAGSRLAGVEVVVVATPEPESMAPPAPVTQTLSRITLPVPFGEL